MTKKRIVGFVCERAMDIPDLTGNTDFVKGKENVAIIKVPCSGMVRPEVLLKAVKGGAEKTFVGGCKIGDCHYRTGNTMVRDRIRRERAPKLKTALADDRVDCFFHSTSEKAELLKDIEEFENKPVASEPPK